MANLVDRIVLLLKREWIAQSGDAARDDSLVSSGLGHDENTAELFLALRDSDRGKLQEILVVEALNLTVLPVWETFLDVNFRQVELLGPDLLNGRILIFREDKEVVSDLPVVCVVDDSVENISLPN